jgi:hypothetical protein
MIISCITHSTASAFARLRTGRSLVELLTGTAVSGGTGRLLVASTEQDKNDHNR